MLKIGQFYLQLNLNEKAMKRFFQRYWLHILIWTGMLIYLIFAPALYPRFFLDAGKPLQVDGNRPVDSNQIKFTIDSFTLRTVNGQDVYVVSGWAFSTLEKSISPTIYNRTMVLTSDTKTYFFPIQTLQRPDVQEAYKDLDMDLINSGFSVLISKAVIRRGKYRIGIIFKNPSSGLAHYSDKPAMYIVRTPNQLFLSEE